VSTTRRLAITLVLGGMSVSALTGCSAPGTVVSEFHVVATTTQIGDFVRHVVGDAEGVAVNQLLQAGSSPHAYDPSAVDLVALGEADLVVENGLELEPWLTDAMAASGSEALIIDTSKGVTFLAGEHDEESDDGDDHDHDHDHDHGEYDPHIWHSAANAQIMVNNILDSLVEADPARASEYTAHAEAYIATLEDLNTWITDSISQVFPSDRLLVTSHDAFGYYIDAYDLEFVGAIIPSLDDSAEASAAEIDELLALIDATGARAIFAETSVNPSAARTLASEAGVTVFAGDEALYADSLGAEGSSGATYIASMVHNTQRIVESWNASQLPLPASLTPFVADVD